MGEAELTEEVAAEVVGGVVEAEAEVEAAEIVGCFVPKVERCSSSLTGLFASLVC